MELDVHPMVDWTRHCWACCLKRSSICPRNGVADLDPKGTGAAKIRKRVNIDTAYMTDWDMIEIGDDSGW